MHDSDRASEGKGTIIRSGLCGGSLSAVSEDLEMAML